MTEQVATEAVELPISEIVERPELQVRRRLDKGAIAAYASRYKSGATMPPVRVARTTTGALVLVDGWHRIAALRSLGSTKVPAEIVAMTERELWWEAGKANIAHGVPLKRNEYRDVFRAYIRARKHVGQGGKLQSYREIAAQIGGTRSYTTVRLWMLKDFPKIAKRMAGEDDAAPGGLQDLPRIDPEDDLLDTAIRGLENAAAAARGIKDPERRGRLVEELRRALWVAEKEGPFVINDDF